jgi:hypothetical protein
LVQPDVAALGRKSGGSRHSADLPNSLPKLKKREPMTFNTRNLQTDTASAAQFYIALGYDQLTEPTTSTHRRSLSRPGMIE